MSNLRWKHLLVQTCVSFHDFLWDFNCDNKLDLWSKRYITLYTSFLAEVFISTTIRLLWEVFSHSQITTRRLFASIFPPLHSRASIYTAEWTGASERVRKCPSFEMAAMRSLTWAPLIKIPAFYHWATNDWIQVGIIQCYVQLTHLLANWQTHAHTQSAEYSGITLSYDPNCQPNHEYS